MKRNTAYSGRSDHWLNTDRGDKLLILMIVLCFPVGLIIMWSRECRWRRIVKCAVSAGFALLIAAIFMLLPDAEDPVPIGGIEIISAKQATKMLAPLVPDSLPETYQLAVNTFKTSALISEPTPTPDPIMVYCNDNGLYYHLKECRYVYTTTPRVTLLAALQAGKSACKICNPPNEMTDGPAGN